MKKAVIALLLAALCLSLCACDSLGSVGSMNVDGIGSIMGGDSANEQGNPSGEKPKLNLFGSGGQQQTAPNETIPAYTEPEYTYPVITLPVIEPTEKTMTTLEYWIENCDSLYLSQSDLYGLTEEECRIARNAIYAKSGRIFSSSDLSDYFSRYSWYYPCIRAENFTDSMLNAAQLHNLNVIIEYESRWD